MLSRRINRRDKIILTITAPDIDRGEGRGIIAAVHDTGGCISRAVIRTPVIVRKLVLYGSNPNDLRYGAVLLAKGIFSVEISESVGIVRSGRVRMNVTEITGGQRKDMVIAAAGNIVFYFEEILIHILVMPARYGIRAGSAGVVATGHDV